jgi:sulfide:quinone oxidoreductase
VTRSIVVLGGGTAGTLAANRLRRALGEDVAITVVDRDDDHLYQPGLLFVPFAPASARSLVRRRSRQLARGVTFRQADVESVDPAGNAVTLGDGTLLPYDVLVVATGARLLPEETIGLTGPGWGTTVHTFYDLAGATALGRALAAFRGGRLVVDVVDLPVKCPVAPLEFCFLADEYFHRRGIRDRVELVYATPLDAAFTRPVAARTLAGLLERKRIELVPEFATGEVRAAPDRTGTLVSYDGRELAFDLAVVVPLHGGAAFVDRSPGLGDELGFVVTDPRTLRARAAPNIFALGDGAAVAASKAGSVAHFEGEVLVRNIVSHLAGREPDARFDGHTNCFVESGFGKALLIDFNDETEPLPGHYPTALGLPLLTPSRLNHLGKRLFAPFYWHALLPGRDVPGIESAMPRAGKQHPFPAPAPH